VGFSGESWTVQCEILQGHLLGGLPHDEDPSLGDNDFPPGGPFDLFGFGQPGNGPAFHQNNIEGHGNAGGGIPGHGFVDAADEPAEAEEVDDLAEIKFSQL
jgi:hypothetical protein